MAVTVMLSFDLEKEKLGARYEEVRTSFHEGLEESGWIQENLSTVWRNDISWELHGEAINGENNVKKQIKRLAKNAGLKEGEYHAMALSSNEDPVYIKTERGCKKGKKARKPVQIDNLDKIISRVG